jgi:hypothetical protein
MESIRRHTCGKPTTQHRAAHVAAAVETNLSLENGQNENLATV